MSNIRAIENEQQQQQNPFEFSRKMRNYCIQIVWKYYKRWRYIRFDSAK